MEEKFCPKCQITKPTSYFYVSKTRPDGLSSYCRECQKADAAIRQAAEPKKRKERPEGKKLCPRCQTMLPVEAFGSNRAMHDGLQSYCRPCSTLAVTESRQRRPESHRRASRNWWKKNEQNTHRAYENGLRERIGKHVEYGTYARLLTEQKGECAICHTETPGPRIKRFHLDHDHSTDAVRGLLCGSCNAVLGYAYDNIDILWAAIEYLTKHAKVKEG